MKVTIPFAFEPEFASSQRETLINNLEIDDRKKDVLSYLQKNPESKLMDVSDNTGISLSSVKKIVTDLKEDGILRNEGTNRNSRWRICLGNDETEKIDTDKKTM